jgi:hypothetical protein
VYESQLQRIESLSKIVTYQPLFSLVVTSIFQPLCTIYLDTKYRNEIVYHIHVYHKKISSKDHQKRFPRTNSDATKGEPNRLLLISFGDLFIAIFISELLSIEILLFQNCLFIFELDSNCIFFFRLNYTCALHLLFLCAELRKESLLVF